MNYQDAISKYLPQILTNIRKNIKEDKSIYDFVSPEDIDSLLDTQEKIIKDYLIDFNVEKLNEKDCYNFYKDLKIPYAVVSKGLNSIKKDILKYLSFVITREELIDFAFYFSNFISIIAKVYIKKEIATLKNRKQQTDYLLLSSHKDFLEQIIKSIQEDKIDDYPIVSAEDCKFSEYLNYLESLMVCMDKHLCKYLKELHVLIHKLSNSFYLFYKKKSFLEAYLIFKDLKEQVLKFENVVKELYFITFSDLEESFFTFIEKHKPNKREFITLIDLKQLKNLNNIYGENIVTRGINILEQKIRSSFEDRKKSLLIRGLTGDFYMYNLDLDYESHKKLINDIYQIITSPIEIEDKIIEFDAVIVGLEIEDYFEVKAEEMIKVLHFLKKEAKIKEKNILLITENGEKEKLKKFLTEKYTTMFIKEKIDTKEIELVFQPIYKTNSLDIFAIETLARIKDDKKLIPAGIFIDKIYEANLIDKFDYVILEKLLEKKDKIERVTNNLFINISAQSLTNKSYLKKLDELLKTFKINIVLEITEQVIVDNMDLIYEIHKKHNVYFAADDFGTGYTSLKSVIELTKNGVLKVLKIDGSLIKNIDKDLFDGKMIKIIANLSKEFELLSVAEFVENRTILELLKKFNIHLAQGYYLSRPKLIEELIAENAGSLHLRVG